MTDTDPSPYQAPRAIRVLHQGRAFTGPFAFDLEIAPDGSAVQARVFDADQHEVDMLRRTRADVFGDLETQVLGEAQALVATLNEPCTIACALPGTPPGTPPDTTPGRRPKTKEEAETSYAYGQLVLMTAFVAMAGALLLAFVSILAG